jgi:hypothetical protein
MKNFNVVVWLDLPALRNEWRDVAKFPGPMLISMATSEVYRKIDYKAHASRKH